MSAPSAPVGDATAAPAAAAPTAAAPTATRTLPKEYAEDLDFLAQVLGDGMEMVEGALATCWVDRRKGPTYVFKLITYMRDQLAPDEYEHLRGWQRARVNAASDSPAPSPPGTPQQAQVPAVPAKAPPPAKHSDARRVDAHALKSTLGLKDDEFITGPVPTDFRTQWRLIRNAVQTRQYTPPQAWELCALVFKDGAFAALERAMCQHYALSSPDGIIDHLHAATTTFDWMQLEDLLVDYFNGSNFVYNLIAQLTQPGETPTKTLDAFDRNRRAISQFTVGLEPSRYRDMEDRLAAALANNVGELYALAQRLNRQLCDLAVTHETIMTGLMLHSLPSGIRRQYFSEMSLSLENIPQRPDRWERLYDLDSAIARVRRDLTAVPTPEPVQLPDPESVPAMAASNRPPRSVSKPARYNDGAPQATSSPRKRPGRNSAPAPAAQPRKQNRGKGDHPGSAKPGGRRQPK